MCELHASVEKDDNALDMTVSLCFKIEMWLSYIECQICTVAEMYAFEAADGTGVEFVTTSDESIVASGRSLC
jgi:hypothetical protein